MNPTTCGNAAIASGIGGALVGVLTIFYPPAVPDDVWSYPFPGSVLLLVSLALALLHLLTAVGFYGVLLADPHRGSRPAAIAVWVAIVAFVALGMAEVLSGLLGEAAADGSRADDLGMLFGLGSLLSAVGSIVAGIIIARAGRWSGLGRWILVGSGVLMIVVVTPAIVSGVLWASQVALIVWSLTFVPLGRAIAGTRQV